MSSRRASGLVGSILVVGTVLTAGLSTGMGALPAGAAARSETAASADAPGAPTAVGTASETFVDRHRPTAANGKCPRLASRTLETAIFYPAEGDPTAVTPQADAPPARGGAPYPLIVFAHGYRAVPASYADLLRHWASAGYVVAAPQFPLSSGESPCGAVAGDSVNQPEDMTFVITSLLERSARRTGPLAGLIDPRRIGAAGHSNGGITTYGVVANTAVRDRRVKAAAILAGTAQGYPKGHYDFRAAPPLLFVHGTDDTLVPYRAAVDGFNRARGPKALLSVNGGDHGSSAGAQTYAATTDFFDAYLRGDAAAKQRLATDETPGVTTMRFVAEPGATTTIPTEPEPELHLRATVTPRTDLSDGQTVTVTWSGYSPGKVVNILQCSGADREIGNPAACDFPHAYLLKPNPTGHGSTTLQVVEGKVGTGVCDAKHPGCFIVVNNASSTDPEDSVRVPIRFAP